MENLSSHKSGIRSGQEHVGLGQLKGLAGPAHGCGIGAGAKGLQLLRRSGGWSGVHTGPGATAFTRMPSPAKALARERVKETTAPLVAL